MPAALEIDKEQVRIVALSVGVREAARQFGLSEGTVSYWSATEGWMKNQAAIEAIQAQAMERKRESQGVQAVPSGSEVLKRYDGESRLFVAKGLHAGAEAISRMDGQEIVMAAQQVGQTVKSLALVHGWASNVTTTLRLDVLASGSSDSAPVIDV